MIWLYWVPKNLLSFMIGWFAHIRWPKPLNQFLIQRFASAYKINLAEMEMDISAYPSLGEFFVRKLKPGMRRIEETWAVVPADSVLTQVGRVTQGKIVEAKGQSFTLTEFIADSRAYEKFATGQHLTYYLCPADYHRVHSPVSGVIRKITHIPGALWPVNKWAVENIKNLFVVNERVVVEIETDRGTVAVVFVGATNVGSIEVSLEPNLHTNKIFGPKGIQQFEYKEPLPIKKGEELGLFRMGSTVVVIYPLILVGHPQLPKTVKVGQALI